MARYAGANCHKRLIKDAEFAKGNYHAALKNTFLGIDEDLLKGEAAPLPLSPEGLTSIFVFHPPHPSRSELCQRDFWLHSGRPVDFKGKQVVLLKRRGLSLRPFVRWSRSAIVLRPQAQQRRYLRDDDNQQKGCSHQFFVVVFVFCCFFVLFLSPGEIARITAAGGFVQYGRVNGM